MLILGVLGLMTYDPAKSADDPFAGLRAVLPCACGGAIAAGLSLDVAIV